MTSIQCILCQTTCANSIEIFGKIGKSENIAQILSTHFWFKIIQPSDNSQFICIECWTKTHNFHVFYQSVENANKECVLEDLNKSCDYHVDDDEEKISFEHSTECCEDVKPVLDDNVTFNYSDLNEMPGVEKEPIDEIKYEKISETYCSDINTSNSICNAPDEIMERITKRPNLLIPSYFDMTCDQCDTVFASLRETREHYRMVHNYADGYIKCCGKRFNRRATIRDHINWHQNPNFYTCDLCKKAFHSKISIRNHMRLHEPEESKKFKCEKCEKKFTRKYILNTHLSLDNCAENEGVNCQHCQKKLKNQRCLKIHIKNFHPNASDRIQETFICAICAKVIKSKSSFLRHEAIYHNANHHKSSHEIQKVHCSLCNVWLKNPRSLKQHNAFVHESSPTKCPYCDKIKANQTSLNAHISSVHSKRTHHCTLCDKSFSSALRLKDHIASHTGECQYSCSYCPRMFVSKTNIRKHQKRMHFEQWTAGAERGQKLHCPLNIVNEKK